MVTDGDELSQPAIKEQPIAPPSLLARIAGPHVPVASAGDQTPKIASAAHPPYVSS